MDHRPSGQGSAELVTDEAGAVVSRMFYTAWGEMRIVSGDEADVPLYYQPAS